LCFPTGKWGSAIFALAATGGYEPLDGVLCAALCHRHAALDSRMFAITPAAIANESGAGLKPAIGDGNRRAKLTGLQIKHLSQYVGGLQ